MKTFTLPAKIVKAANLFRAGNDPRYYLKGFLVSANDVLATDGCTLICAKLNEEIENHEPKIIRTMGHIPAKSDQVEFSVSESGADGTAFCRCANGKVLGVIYFEVIDGKFPERARNYLSGEEKPVSKIGINCKYLDRLYEASKLICVSGRYGEPKSAATFNGDTGAMRFDLIGIEYEATVIIMPMSL